MRNRLLKSAARGVLVGVWARDPRHSGGLAARRRRGHLGPPEHSVNARADPDAAIRGPAGRRTGTSDGYLRYKAVRAFGRLRREHAGSRHSRCRDRAARHSRDQSLLQLSESPLQPCPQGPRRERDAARPRAAGKAAADGRPHVPVAGGDLSDGRTSRLRGGRSSTETAAGAPVRSNTSTIC